MSRPVSIVAEPLEAAISVSIADPGLALTMADAIASELRATVASFTLGDPRVVRLRTRKRLARLGADGVRGAIVVVRVTGTSARRLPSLVEDVRAAGALGVQLVWDGITPARGHVEPHVFAVLEQARSTPAGPPVVLARDEEVAFALRLLVEQRAKVREPGKEEGSRS